jgi:hypothetical protein
MLQCKIISGSDIATVEYAVNEFLKKTARLIIHSIHQSSSLNSIHITILYNLRVRRDKLRDAAIDDIAVPINQNQDVN